MFGNRFRYLDDFLKDFKDFDGKNMPLKGEKGTMAFFNKEFHEKIEFSTA